MIQLQGFPPQIQDRCLIGGFPSNTISLTALLLIFQGQRDSWPYVTLLFEVERNDVPSRSS